MLIGRSWRRGKKKKHVYLKWGARLFSLEVEASTPLGVAFFLENHLGTFSNANVMQSGCRDPGEIQAQRS